MSKDFSMEIVTPIMRFLCEEEWHFGVRSEEGMMHFGLNLDNRIKEVKFLVRLHETDYTVYGICTKKADPDDSEMMRRMAFFLHRANYNLRFGNFELDEEDGEIRYKNHVDCEDLPGPTDAMVRNSIHACVAMFKRYGDAICHIIEDGMTAADAIELAEGPGASRPHAEDEDVEDIEDIIEILEDEDIEDIIESLDDEDPGEDPEIPDLGQIDSVEELLRLIRGMRED